MQSLILPLAQCFANRSASEELERTSFRRPWGLRICAERGVSPMERARVTIATFLSPVDGWGERGGLTSLLCWLEATEHAKGFIAEFRAAVEAELARLPPEQTP